MAEDAELSDEEMDDFENDEEIVPEDAWIVISQFFELNGMVRQQLDSFNNFMHPTIQSLITDCQEVMVKPESQHKPGEEIDGSERHVLRFKDVSIAKPSIIEADGTPEFLKPNEARLRGLTYSALLYVNIDKSVIRDDPENGVSEEIEEQYEDQMLGKCQSCLNPNIVYWMGSETRSWQSWESAITTLEATLSSTAARKS